MKEYAKAGVDIQLADALKSGLKKQLRRASRPEVIGGIGGFGALFDISRLNYREPVLVSSVDGVGTKLKLAFSTGRHEVVGQDIVNHCLNDIAVMGAEPLFFLDYIGMGRLEPVAFNRLVTGMAAACRKANCALIGGETAQMPGFYQAGEYDLVGSIVGVVEKKKILTGAMTRPGDRLVGLASNGLHTNGYSLAGSILFTKLRYRLDDPMPGDSTTIGDALLQPHINYATALHKALETFNTGRAGDARKDNAIFGAVHITGGGFPGNMPRVLPGNCDAVIDTGSWSMPAIFEVLATSGGVTREELYEVFNMGIGMALMVEKAASEAVIKFFRKFRIKARDIGEVIEGEGRVELR